MATISRKNKVLMGAGEFWSAVLLSQNSPPPIAHVCGNKVVSVLEEVIKEPM
jgi:hypothetical protein